MFMRIAVAALLALTMSANAQDRGRGRGERFEPDRSGPPGEARILGAMAGPPGPVVKGAPYSATMVTETTQVLPDGNRIRQTSTAKIFRDAEGRVRSEVPLGGLGALGPALASSGASPTVVFINDPVAGVDYVINQRDKTVTKSPGRERGGRPPEMNPRSDGKNLRTQEGPPREWGMRSKPGRGHNENFKVDSLGRQSIEGISAAGARTTMTIPAGQIGNEQPIQIVSERWYSPELQTVVLSRHSDPRTGETVSRLVSVSRSDPPQSLFQPPSDYRLTEARRDGRFQPQH